MITLMAGLKGEGKTRRLIEEANAKVDVSHGNIVYIDDDRRNIHALHQKIRFVTTEGFPLRTFRELGAFIHGILSQNSDITEMYLDGINNIVRDIDNDGLVGLKRVLDVISADFGVAFTMSINIEPELLPEEYKELL